MSYSTLSNTALAAAGKTAVKSLRTTLYSVLDQLSDKLLETDKITSSLADLLQEMNLPGINSIHAVTDVQYLSLTDFDNRISRFYDIYSDFTDIKHLGDVINNHYYLEAEGKVIKVKFVKDYEFNVLGFSHDDPEFNLHDIFDNIACKYTGLLYLYDYDDVASFEIWNDEDDKYNRIRVEYDTVEAWLPLCGEFYNDASVKTLSYYLPEVFGISTESFLNSQVQKTNSLYIIKELVNVAGDTSSSYLSGNVAEINSIVTNYSIKIKDNIANLYGESKALYESSVEALKGGIASVLSFLKNLFESLSQGSLSYNSNDEVFFTDNATFKMHSTIWYSLGAAALDIASLVGQVILFSGHVILGGLITALTTVAKNAINFVRNKVENDIYASVANVDAAFYDFGYSVFTGEINQASGEGSFYHNLYHEGTVLYNCGFAHFDGPWYSVYFYITEDKTKIKYQLRPTANNKYSLGQYLYNKGLLTSADQGHARLNLSSFTTDNDGTGFEKFLAFALKGDGETTDIINYDQAAASLDADLIHRCGASCTSISLLHLLSQAYYLSGHSFVQYIDLDMDNYAITSNVTFPSESLASYVKLYYIGILDVIDSDDHFLIRQSNWPAVTSWDKFYKEGDASKEVIPWMENMTDYFALGETGYLNLIFHPLWISLDKVEYNVVNNYSDTNVLTSMKYSDAMPAISVPLYVRSSYIASAIITGVILAAAVGAVTVYLIKGSIGKAAKRAKLQGNAEKAWSAFQNNPTRANYKAYKKAVRANNRYATIFGGSKLSKDGFWVSGGASTGLPTSSDQNEQFAELKRMIMGDSFKDN